MTMGDWLDQVALCACLGEIALIALTDRGRPSLKLGSTTPGFER